MHIVNIFHGTLRLLTTMGAHIEQLPLVLWLRRSIPFVEPLQFMSKSDTNLTRPFSLKVQVCCHRCSICAAACISSEAMRESDMEGVIELSSTVLLLYWPRMSACSKQHSQSQLSCVSFASLGRDVRLELLGAGRARGSERRN